MKRTTIFLDAGLERDLKLFAERQQRTTASVVREALGQWVEAQRAVPARRPGFVRMGRSGHADTAERHEALVFGALEPHDDEVQAKPAGRVGRQRTGLPGRRASR